MFANYGIGFLGGFIGVAITFLFTFIFQQINIIYCFSERLKTLQAKVEVRDPIVRMGTKSEVLLSKLVQEASDMVKDGHNVPRWNLTRRYRISKRMAKLILDINKERSSLLFEIVIHQTSAARNPAADLQMDAAEGMAAEEQEVVHTDAVEEIRVAAEEQAVAQTDAVEETAAAEEQKVLHTVTVERMAIADEMGLRQRVGTRKKIVLKLMIENEKIKKRAINAIAGVGGVESVSVDIETKEVVVVGEADPVFLTAKLRKIGITELMSVGPAIEEKKAEGEKKEGPKE